MLPIPAALQASFEAYLRTGEIPETARSYYKKWLRFYLDFCQKYHAAPSQRESPKNLVLLRGKGGYEKLDRYKQAVLGINHVLETHASLSGVRLASSQKDHCRSALNPSGSSRSSHSVC